MPVIQVNGANVDVEQDGAGRDLVLLHSLLAERSAFDGDAKSGKGLNTPVEISAHGVY